jgi:hypothetical protein
MLAFNGCVSAECQDTGLWWVSTLSFTLIIHVVTMKLFLESVFWNKVNLTVGAISVTLYYVVVIVLNTEPFAVTFQPQLLSLFFNVLGNGSAWVVIFLAPPIALLPDLLLVSYRAIFAPTPTDAVVILQKAEKS